MVRPSFKTLFCEKFGCSLENYEKRAFREFLYWHARLVAPLIQIIYPGFFRQDMQFIHYLGESLDARQARADTLDFKDHNRKHWRMLHGTLRIRVSGRKASRVAFQLLGGVDPAEAFWPKSSRGTA